MPSPAVRKLTVAPEIDADLKRDAVYEQILLDIICGDLAAGEWVDEGALADRYLAGRAGIRDALFRLSLEGLVERRPRLGTVVSSPSFFELQQVFELRVQIEGQCASMAALNARPAEIQAIGAVFADADNIIANSDWRTLVRLDRSFHHAMAVAAHNVWMERTLITLHNSALRFWHHSLARRQIDAVKSEITSHREVAAAIAASDPAGAQAAMRKVLGEFPATVRGMFSDLPEAAK
jgi:DNA-binding GntR family transcriptional regulator